MRPDVNVVVLLERMVLAFNPILLGVFGSFITRGSFFI